MKLKDYIIDADIDRVMEVMCSYWPNQRENRGSYADVLDRLKGMEPSDKYSDWFICVDKVTDPDGEYLAVVGKDSEGEFYSIEFFPWSGWLGMEIQPKSMESLSKYEILAGILFEITFAGFDEVSIAEQNMRIDNLLNEAENLLGI